MTETELLCHRAPYPSTLAARQAAAWDPVLDWSAQHLGIPFHPSADLIAQKQTPQNMTLLHKRLAHYDDFTFTGLRHTAEVCGSLLLGLALTEGHIQAEHVLALSEIESDFQMENWGHDEATLKRRASIANDLNVCATWFEKLKDTP